VSEGLVTVSDTVLGKVGGRTAIRWVVVATFVGVGGTEPRCVDYRVRVVPGGSRGEENLRDAHRVLRAMEQDTTTAEQAAALGPVPAGGIPRRVFEVASQARLLEKARAKATRRPELVAEEARQLLERPARRRGRPPRRSLAEKLRVLADVDEAFAGSDRTLADVAQQHNMSRSALRDLLGWARHDAHPPLFVSYGPGRRGGHLTPEARALLASTEED
jgi:hypothetical protein